MSKYLPFIYSAMATLEVPEKIRRRFIHAAVLLSMLDPVRGEASTQSLDEDPAKTELTREQFHEMQGRVCLWILRRSWDLTFLDVKALDRAFYQLIQVSFDCEVCWFGCRGSYRSRDGNRRSRRKRNDITTRPQGALFLGTRPIYMTTAFSCLKGVE
jgi:hypothetical protein